MALPLMIINIIISCEKEDIEAMMLMRAVMDIHESFPPFSLFSRSQLSRNGPTLPDKHMVC